MDPRRHDKVTRYKAPQNQADSDLMPDYMNILGKFTKKISLSKLKYCCVILWCLGMIFSMCGLMMKLKWCAWLALYCSCISFANSRASDDAKQVKICCIY